MKAARPFELSVSSGIYQGADIPLSVIRVAEGLAFDCLEIGYEHSLPALIDACARRKLVDTCKKCDTCPFGHFTRPTSLPVTCLIWMSPEGVRL